jgi:hypothetical protein
MNKRLEQDVREWLRAEHTGSDELAERALARALAELGRCAPGAGFADRVLLSAGRLTPASRAWRSWWARGAVAACLLAAGLATAMLPAWLLVADPVARAFGSPLVSGVWHWMCRWMIAGFTSWTVIEDVGSALRASLVTPAAIVLIAANVLLAAASLLGLKRLLKAPEELIPW